MEEICALCYLPLSNVPQQDEITVDTVLDSLKAMQEQLREKNQKYNEMKQRFETSNEVISNVNMFATCVFVVARACCSKPTGVFFESEGKLNVLVL